MSMRRFRAIGGFLDNTDYMEFDEARPNMYRLTAKPGKTLITNGDWSDGIEDHTGYTLSFAEEKVVRRDWEELSGEG